MKDQQGVIKTEHRIYVQRIEGYLQAPQFVIGEHVFQSYTMGESYVTKGVQGEHHTLDALVCIEDRYIDEGLQWFELHMDYHANTWSLKKTEAPDD